jgi:hypothetical protein
MKLSRPFLCCLAGIAMTLFAWYGPWEWPGAPGFSILSTFFAGHYDELTYGQRAAVLVLLIVVNVGTWAVAAFALISFSRSIATLRR